MAGELYVCMTSGIEGPKIGLTEEQSQTVIDLANQLTTPWSGSEFAGLGLGTDHYLVSLGEEAEIVAVRVKFSGFVSLWKKGDNEWHDLTDTVGLWGYLAPIASQAYQNWIAANYTP